jgi:hypothetical protein
MSTTKEKDMTSKSKGGERVEKTKINSLREKAKELLEKAEELEKAKMLKIGKLVWKYSESGFKGFDAEKFKKEVLEIQK